LVSVVESMQLLCEGNELVRPNLVQVAGLMGVLASLLKSSDDQGIRSCCCSLLSYVLFQFSRDTKDIGDGSTLHAHQQALAEITAGLLLESDKSELYLQVLVNCLAK